MSDKAAKPPCRGLDKAVSCTYHIEMGTAALVTIGPKAPQMNICGHRWANKNNSNAPQPTKVTLQPQTLGGSKSSAELK